jgi:hypothetical protein
MPADIDLRVGYRLADPAVMARRGYVERDRALDAKHRVLAVRDRPLARECVRPARNYRFHDRIVHARPAGSTLAWHQRSPFLPVVNFLIVSKRISYCRRTGIAPRAIH